MQRHEVTVGERKFYIRPFEPFLALHVLGSLQKRLIGPIAAAFEDKEARDPEADAGKAVMAAFAKLSAGLDGDQLVALAKLLLKPDYVAVDLEGNGDPVKLTEGAANMAFRDAGDIILLCIEVVKANYADFGKRAVALIGAARVQEAFKSLPAGFAKT